MRSASSVQCHPGVWWGADCCTPPRLWVSSWASTDWPLRPQHPESTRAYDGPRLLALSEVARSSPMMLPIPQYTLESTQTRYLRSVRLYPRADSSDRMLLKL